MPSKIVRGIYCNEYLYVSNKTRELPSSSPNHIVVADSFELKVPCPFPF